MSRFFKYRINNKEFIVSNGAFGSGEHETTAGCLSIIENMCLEGKKFLDVGCGTGILSVAAALCGAKSVVGFDISYDACVTSKKNFKFNNIDNAFVVCSDNRSIKGKFDVIVANIYVEIILSLLEYHYNSLNKDGYLILSGIPIEEAYTVKSKYIDFGFNFVKNIYHEDFVTILFQK